MVDERSLILKVKSGSVADYNELYRLWVSRLYHFVYRYVKSEQAADDIVQEAFLRIWTNRENLNPDYSFKSYLFTISYHLLLKELRFRLNNPSMEEYVEYQNLRIVSEESIEEEVDFDRFQQALREAKKKLTPRQREIFELNKEQGFSVAEIAGKLSVQEQVVRNQLSASLKVIRTELQDFIPLLGLFLTCC